MTPINYFGQMQRSGVVLLFFVVLLFSFALGAKKLTAEEKAKRMVEVRIIIQSTAIDREACRTGK